MSICVSIRFLSVCNSSSPKHDLRVIFYYSFLISFCQRFQSVMYARSMKISKKLDESVAHSIEVGHEQFMEDLRQQSIGNKWRDLFDFFFCFKCNTIFIFLNYFLTFLGRINTNLMLNLHQMSQPWKSRTFCWSECFCKVFFDIRYKFDFVQKIIFSSNLIILKITFEFNFLSTQFFFAYCYNFKSPMMLPTNRAELLKLSLT